MRCLLRSLRSQMLTTTGVGLLVLLPTGSSPWIVFKQKQECRWFEYQFMPVTEHSEAKIGQFWTKGELFDLSHMWMNSKNPLATFWSKTRTSFHITCIDALITWENCIYQFLHFFCFCNLFFDVLKLSLKHN